MTTSAAITVHGLTHHYRTGKTTFIAVDDVSFHVERGEVFGLLGTNGAGKTTTLEILEGLSAATHGEVRVLGLDPVADRQQLRPDLGIMLQSGGLPSQLTVAETLRMWAGTCSTPRPVEDVLIDVDLTHRATIKVGSLSGGEQRRLDLACALIGDPALLFLDEPTTGLDPESRHNVWNLLDALRERGVTMLLTTHYLEEAEALCDRIAIMHAGRIRVEGTLEGLVSAVPATITATLPEHHPPLPEMPGAYVSRDGSRLTISTNQLSLDSFRLLTWAAHGGVTLEHFAARPATLESVFLDIAGAESLTV
ncbi:MAG: ABC transporter ATP-binding protein [Corynebacterium sp.]|uniref:ABC transporter ATP-binding protein n=1 Tax=Corynebacterium sp. TaxID=1720 RepID=UPI0026E0D6D0|nr:ABC transporter ATP-binding protein [Corynebacterium sp.]MDO5669329.1 ABC transporter ATP-binding protein [Corynebacterium sp.]